MKRIICLLLCLLMLMSLAACGEPGGNTLAPSDGTGDQQEEGGSTQDKADPVDIQQKLSLSAQHTTYLDTAGNLYVWGNNQQYQLGYGGTKDKPTPYRIMTEVKDVLAMPFLTMALKTNGDLYVFGTNRDGVLGFGDETTVSEPQKLLSDVVSFAHDGTNGTAITQNGDLYAWGCNFTNEPVKVLENAAQLVTGQRRTAVITKDKTLYSWRYSDDAVYTEDGENRIEEFKLLDNVSRVFVEASALAAITDDGTLYAHGDFGVFAISENGMDAPYKLLDNVADVSLYDRYLLALTTSGTAYYYGEMNADHSTGTPEKVFDNAKVIHATEECAFFVDANNDLYSWGKNDAGRLGNGTLDDAAQPAKILGNIARVYTNPDGNSVAALAQDGALYTWGYNYYGLLGYEAEIINGSKISMTPTKILDDVTSVYFAPNPFGCHHAAAICKDGSLYLWGSNTDGVLGNGTEDTTVTPCQPALS